MTKSGKHLLYITESVFPETRGSIQTYVYAMARLAVAAGYRITLVAARQPGTPEREEIDGVTVYRFDTSAEGKINYYLSCIKGADRTVRQILDGPDKVDLVHFFHHIPALGARLSGKLKKFPNTVFSHFGSLAMEYSVKSIGKDRGAGHRAATGMHIEGSIFPLLMDTIEAKNFSKCKRVFVLTRHSRERVLQEKVKKDRILIVPPGVDHARFTPAAPGEKQKLLRATGPVYTFVGEMNMINAPDLFVEAASRIAEVQPQARFLMIGSGEEEGAIREQLSQHKLADRATVLPSSDRMPEYLRCSDWLVSTSLDDRFRLAYYEAMACGVPVAAFDLGGIREYLTPAHGVVVPPQQTGELARAMLAFDLRRPADLSATLRQAVLGYTWEAVFDKIHAVYRSLMP